MKKQLFFFLFVLPILFSEGHLLSLESFLLDEQTPSIFFPKVTDLLRIGYLSLSPEGDSGCYLLQDSDKTAHFIIKPSDEALHCHNNPKLSTMPPHLPHIPPCQSAQREAVTYQIAMLCQLESVVIPTHLTLLSLPHHPHQKKLCSIQPFQSHTKTLRSFLSHYFSLGLTDDQITPLLDNNSLEKLHVLLWITYDNDAHAGNFLVDISPLSHPYPVKKIDNSLSFPEQNKGLYCFLMHLPQAKSPLSQEIKSLIAACPLFSMETLLQKFLIGNAIPALQQRIHLLKSIASRPDITYYEIYLRMLLIENNLNLAYSQASIEQLYAAVEPFLKTYL